MHYIDVEPDVRVFAQVEGEGKPIVLNAPSSNGSKDYMELAKEVMARGG
jgi:cellulose biosynthesis protein BcsQ